MTNPFHSCMFINVGAQNLESYRAIREEHPVMWCIFLGELESFEEGNGVMTKFGLEHIGNRWCNNYDIRVASST